jgi:hypothetical protein
MFIQYSIPMEERKLISLILSSCSGNPVSLFHLLTHGGEAGGEKAGLSNPLLLFQETLSACSTCCHGERLEERKLASLILSSCFRKPC